MSLYTALTQVLAPYAAKINGLLTGWNGTVYSTPGEAVRQQIADLHVLIGDEPGTAISASAISYGENSNVDEALTTVNGRLTQQAADIGDLSELETTDKTDIVSALNEVNEKAGHATVTVDTDFSTTSENPLKNRTITGAFCEDVYTPVCGTTEIDESANFTSTSVCYILADSTVEANTDIKKVSAFVKKTEGATYKFKLVEFLQTAGKGIYTATKVSNELTFSEPQEDSELVSVTLDTPFTITAGHGLALVPKESGLFKYDTKSITEGGTYFVVRPSVVYDSVVVGFKLMNQTAIPTPSYKLFSATVFDSELAPKTFMTAAEVGTLVKERIDRYASLVDTKYDVSAYNYIPGKLTNGEVVEDSLNRKITVDKFIYLKKGESLLVATTERITEIAYYDSNLRFVSQTTNAAMKYVIPSSGYYKWSIDLQYNFGENIIPYQLSDNTFIGQINNYDPGQLTILNEIMVTKDPLILSNTNQKMSHCAMMDFDPSDNTMWVVYYANEVTTTENNTDVRTYLTIKHFNPYTKETIGETTFKVGDTIGNYTQAVTPPYDPTITVLANYVLVTFWGNENGERCISCFRVNKETLAMSDYAINKLAYNGVSYDLNCTNLKTIYEAYSGTTIGTIDTVAFSCHFPVYNGEYYGVINDIFSASGYKSFLVKSSDLINWSIVHCFAEIPATNEASITIRNGILYMADRQNGYLTKYTFASGAVEFVKIPLSLMCKMCIFNMKDALNTETIVLISNIVSDYNASKEGFRRNLGIFTVDENLGIKMISRILTTQGCHYPDLASDGFDLFMLWSEDRRNINRKVQRSNIAFSKVFI